MIAIFASVSFLALSPGSVQAALDVNVQVNPAFIVLGGSSTLSWTVREAVTCTASDSHGWSSDWPPTSGSMTVAPTGNVTYILDCTDAFGNKMRSAFYYSVYKSDNIA